MGGCDEFGATTVPLKEHLLREEYPDLKEKWIIYQCREQIFSSIDKRSKKFGAVRKFLYAKEYDRVRADWKEAKSLYENAEKEYLILQKLLWDY